MAKVGKGSLVTILGLLVGVAAVFVGTSAAVLAAKGRLNREGLSRFRQLPLVGRCFPEPPTPKPGAGADQPSPAAFAAAAPQESAIQAMSSGEIRRLMSEAQKLRDEFKAKQQTLATHKRRLESIEKDLTRKRAEIEAVKQAVEQAWEELRLARQEIEKDKVVFHDSERKNLKRMAKVYEAMPADSAAATMAGVEEDTVVKLLFLMNERAAGKVLAALKPEEAGRITEKMRRMRETSGPPPADSRS